MTSEPGAGPEERALRAALQDAVQDRFDGVDWDGLHDRIVARASGRNVLADRPAHVLAAWSVPAAAAAVLVTAGTAALLLFSDAAQADAVPPDFWVVAEELIAAVPDDTRRLIDAGSDVDGLIRLVRTAGEGSERQ